MTVALSELGAALPCGSPPVPGYGCAPHAPHHAMHAHAGAATAHTLSDAGSSAIGSATARHSVSGLTQHGAHAAHAYGGYAAPSPSLSAGYAPSPR